VWIGVVAFVHPLIPTRGVDEDYGENPHGIASAH
jgi:hypothetical protein